MKKILLGTTALAFLGVAGAATAADIAKAPARTVVATPVAPSWSGCYVGLHAGWASSDAQDNTLPTAVSPTDEGPLTEGDPIVFGFGGGFDGSGFAGGAQIGCDRQYGNVVFGLVGDFSWSSNDESLGSFQISPSTPTTSAPETATFEVEHFGTARARLGFVTPFLASNTLIYGTVGLAWARGSYSISGEVFNPATTSFAVSAKADHLGWAAGLGLEWMFAPSWSFGVEYLHLDLGDADYNFGSSFHNVTTAVSLGRPVNVDLEMDVIRANLNFRF
jgi:outer membrane immunogenic protein